MKTKKEIMDRIVFADSIAKKQAGLDKTDPIMKMIIGSFAETIWKSYQDGYKDACVDLAKQMKKNIEKLE